MALPAPRATLAAAATLLAPGIAQAHTVSASLGDFYGGGLHLLSSPEQLLAVVGVGLLLGQGDRDAAHKRVVLALPPALAAGVLATALVGPWPETPWVGAGLLVMLGGLVAAALHPPRAALAALIVLVGVACGLANGPALTPATDVRLFIPGVALAGFLVALYAMLLAQAARPFWATIALRIAGSWIAATGLLVLGMRR